MPTTPPILRRIVQLAAVAVAPAFALAAVSLSPSLTEIGSPERQVAVSPSIESADTASQRALTAPTSVSGPASASPSRPVSGPETSAADTSATANSREVAPIQPKGPSTPAHRPSSDTAARPHTRASQSPDVTVSQTRTGSGDEVAVPNSRNRATSAAQPTTENQVDRQGADQAPAVSGPRNPGRAPLVSAKPTTLPSEPAAPTTSQPTTSQPPASDPISESTSPTSPPSTTSPTTATSPNSATSNVETLLFNKINAYRVANGVAPLVRNAAMDSMSRNWSNQMATTSTFFHNPDMGAQTPSGWSRIGENIAYCSGYSSDDEVVAEVLFRLWVNSPGHNANMLDARFNTGSMGIAKVGSSTYYATQNFARY